MRPPGSCRPGRATRIRLRTRATGSALDVADASDHDDRLQALYGLRRSVAESIDVGDRSARAIVAAVDSLIEECGGTPPGETDSTD